MTLQQKFRLRLINLLPKIYDGCAVIVTYFFVYWFRFNFGAFPIHELQLVAFFLPLVLLIQELAFFYFGLYRGIWRFASIPDLVRIIKAVFFGTFGIVLIHFFVFNELTPLPRSIPPLYFLVLVALLGAGRISVRWFKDYRKKKNQEGQKVLIVGAGSAGEGLIRDLLRHRQQSYIPIGIVDDNPARQKLEIHGIRILGKCSEIVNLVKKYDVDLIFITIPSLDAKEMRTIVDYCVEAKVPFRALPSLNKLADGMVKIDALRTVSVEDLLGREVVENPLSDPANLLANNTLLVTGAGGSIGSELCRQIATYHPEKMILVDHSEYALYSIHQELITQYPNLSIEPCLVSIVDRRLIREVLGKYQPSVIFHAAAYKHVPLLESQGDVAIKNNVIGTKVLSEEAARANVNLFLLVSTDKAVNPTNIMGTTKRAAECYCQWMNENSNTKFITVRFGNVLDSAGSVIPLFKSQLKKGGPITVTHPDITRFFMTIPEAVRLILQATLLGNGGEIFVLDMGEPVKIQYLAEQMIRLSGLEPEKDIKIIHTGLRPGEKLYEELFYKAEELLETPHQKISLAKSYRKNGEDLEDCFHQIEAVINKASLEELVSLLQKIVPEYQTARLDNDE